MNKTIDNLTNDEFIDFLHSKFNTFLILNATSTNNSETENFIKELNCWYIQSLQFEKYEWCIMLQNILNYINKEMNTKVWNGQKCWQVLNDIWQLLNKVKMLTKKVD